MQAFSKLKTAVVSAATLASSLVATTPVLAQLEEVDIDISNTGFFTSPGSLINSIIRFVFALAALLVFFYLIWGGIDWITSGGDKGKTEGARNKITSAIIGLIVLAASYAILQIVLNFLGYTGINQVFDQTRL